MVPCYTAESYVDADIREIERIVYNFFWSNKAPAINRDVLSLPKSHGGCNIHRIKTKIAALRLNTLRRLIDPTPANWKLFTAHYLRIAGMHLGERKLTQTYDDKQIDRTIPTYHKELLRAWNKLQPHIQRTNPPTDRQTILNEPIFLNKHIMDKTNSCILFENWVREGILYISDICYIVIPGFLPPLAINDLLSNTSTIDDTEQQLNTIIDALPKHWVKAINTNTRNYEHDKTKTDICLSNRTRRKQI